MPNRNQGGNSRHASFQGWNVARCADAPTDALSFPRVRPTEGNSTGVVARWVLNWPERKS